MKIISRSFGIELESHPTMSGEKITQIIKKNTQREVIKTKWRQTYAYDFWHVKTDSTCGGGKKKGWEIASFKASGAKDLLEICKVANSLKIAGLRCGEDCGFHVHVDISDFSIEQVSILLAYWVKIEKILLKATPSHRSKNKYCTSIASNIFEKNKKWDCYEFWQMYGPKNTSIHNNKDKRVTMNLVNYLHYHQCAAIKNLDTRSTVEFRFPEGTFDQINIKNWVIFFINFVENIKNKPMPENLMCVKNLDQFLKISGIKDKNNKKWILCRLINFDTNKRWRKISEKQIFNMAP